MRFVITTNRFLELLKAELNDEYEAFENAFCKKLITMKNVFSDKPISHTEKFEALQYAIGLFDDKLSATLKTLSCWLSNSESTISIKEPKGNSYSTSRPVKDSKAKLQPQKSADHNEKSVALDENNLLSRTKTKKITKSMKDALERGHFYRCPSPDQCDVCPRLFQEVPLSRCTHDKPHDHGWYPHVNRQTLRRIHRTREFLPVLAMTGLPNPLKVAKQPIIETSTTLEKDCGQMDTESSTVQSKKRKISGSPSEAESCALFELPQFYSSIEERVETISRARKTRDRDLIARASRILVEFRK